MPNNDIYGQIDELIQRGSDYVQRFSPEARARARRARERRRKRALKVINRMFLAALAIVVAAIAVGLFVAPIGMEGALIALVAVVLSWIAIGYFSSEGEPTPEAMTQTDLPLLPQRTEEWLERQRPALPAPSQRLLDGIGVKLEALAPQLATLDPREPAAFEVRKLLCDDLPELVKGYQKVPAPLRKTGRDGGHSPDDQLAEGLRVVDSEIARMTEQLAAGDLKQLATQGRYLELKYRDGGEG
ncbi:hypothetical protein [Sphingomonas sp. ID0503]|uniref:hypothetical protein n=1 Tax=Sphingomonas sp. ID0503 TaxID=3399691 RepID=UPI003AFA32A2